MMKTPIFIHIGTHKTGTTAIQHFSRHNMNRLRQAGLVYVSVPSEITPLMTSDKLSIDIIRSLRKHLARQIMEHQKKDGDIRFLLSWEGFSGEPTFGYNNAGIVAEHLKRITENMEACIIVYLRRQDEFVESLYTQKIQEGESYSFQAFVESLSDFSFDWARFLSCYVDRFGKENMVVKRYDRAFLPEPDSLLKDFFPIVGVDIQDTISHSDLPTPNRGYSRDALEIARLSNPHLTNDEKRRLRRILQQISSKQIFESYSYWSNEERGRFLAKYSESNAIVAKEYFNESSGLLFPFSATCKGNHGCQAPSLEAMIPMLVKAMLSEQETEATSVPIVAKVERKLIALLNKFPWLKSKVKNLAQREGISAYIRGKKRDGFLGTLSKWNINLRKEVKGHASR